jgi:hypothetical protein
MGDTLLTANSLPRGELLGTFVCCRCIQPQILDLRPTLDRPLLNCLSLSHFPGISAEMTRCIGMDVFNIGSFKGTQE